MKANIDKTHLIMSCAEATTAMIDGLPIDSSKTEVLLGITIDHELKFDDHVNHLCKKASDCPYCIFCEWKANYHEVIYWITVWALSSNTDAS